MLPHCQVELVGVGQTQLPGTGGGVKFEGGAAVTLKVGSVACCKLGNEWGCSGCLEGWIGLCGVSKECGGLGGDEENKCEVEEWMRWEERGARRGELMGRKKG
eukprot:363874-Chlamydomonas_euryale.AAC.4